MAIRAWHQEHSRAVPFARVSEEGGLPMAKQRFHYDAVVKDLFQKDRPTLLGMYTGPVKVREFLNFELPTVEERFADLLVLLGNGSLLHFEFQSGNDPWMPHRVGGYGLAAARKYKKPRIRQVVIYIGAGPMRMANHLDLGEIEVKYTLVDIREFDAEMLLRSGNPGDLALALLAGNGMEKWGEIMERCVALPEPDRKRVMAGLRPMPERFRMELETMRISNDIEKHPILGSLFKELRVKSTQEGREEGLEQGLAKGKAEGEAEARIRLLNAQLEAKFGKPLPRWASKRIQDAKPRQHDKWLIQLLKADTLEGVIGKREAAPAARKR
jgi:hypothetical protein